MAKISVVIPVYNVARYLRQCIDSVLNQTFKDLEIIIINDCSTDNSKDIIQDYLAKDSRIKFVDNVVNLGYAKSVNNGIKQASGKYIGIVESDDFIEPNMYETLLNMLEKYNADVAKCNYWNFYGEQNLNVVSSTSFSKLKNKIFNIKENPEVLASHPSVWCGLYSKDLLINNSIFFTETPNGAYLDILWTFKVFMSASRIVVTDIPLLHYRQDNSNSTVNNPQKVFCISDEYDLLTEYIENHSELKPYVNKFKLKKQYRDYLWNLQRIVPEHKKLFLDKFVKTFSDLEKDERFYSDFPKKHRRELRLLLNSPSVFLEKYSTRKRSFFRRTVQNIVVKLKIEKLLSVFKIRH